MLEPTKTPPIDTVRLCFVGPQEKREEAVRVLRNLGFVDTSECMDWRDALTFESEELPGAVLAAARGRERLTQRELAERTGISQRHISEMERGKRSIGKERAKRLAETLNTSYKVFL